MGWMTKDDPVHNDIKKLNNSSTQKKEVKRSSTKYES
jgi:hypothetical protein